MIIEIEILFAHFIFELFFGKKYLLVGMQGCFSGMIVWLVGPAMYVFSTNQIEATMNNQSNIVDYNHTCWRQLNLLWQDGGENSVLLIQAQHYDNGNIFWGNMFWNMFMVVVWNATLRWN